MVADFEPFFLAGENEAIAGPAFFTALAETVKELYDAFDGIVILHHLHAIEYAAAALALMVQKPGKPIVLTGSPYSLIGKGGSAKLTSVFEQYHGLGVKANLLNALYVAVSDIRGVFLMFGNRLMLGAQVMRSGNEIVNPFTALAEHTFGAVDFGLRFGTIREKRSERKPTYRIGLDGHVQAIALHPSASFGFGEAIAEDTKAILFHAEGRGPFDFSVLPNIAEFLEGRIVVVHAEYPNRVTPPQGAVVVSSMTYPMTFMKTMWALAQKKGDRKAVARLLTKNVVGEVRRGKKG